MCNNYFNLDNIESSIAAFMIINVQVSDHLFGYKMNNTKMYK